MRQAEAEEGMSTEGEHSARKARGLLLVLGV